MTRFQLSMCMMLTLFALSVGCNSKPEPVPVTMTVQHKGKPVTDVRINLIGSTGSSSFAFTDSSGKSEGFKSAGVDGVVPGEYTVTLASKEETALDSGDADYSAKPAKVSFPAKYKSSVSSDQKITVDSSGENNFTVELTD